MSEQKQNECKVVFLCDLENIADQRSCKCFVPFPFVRGTYKRCSAFVGMRCQNKEANRKRLRSLLRQILREIYKKGGEWNG